MEEEFIGGGDVSHIVQEIPCQDDRRYWQETLTLCHIQYTQEILSLIAIYGPSDCTIELVCSISWVNFLLWIHIYFPLRKLYFIKFSAQNAHFLKNIHIYWLDIWAVSSPLIGIWILAPDWLRIITWSGYWSMIGQYLCKLVCDWSISLAPEARAPVAEIQITLSSGQHGDHNLKFKSEGL